MLLFRVFGNLKKIFTNIIHSNQVELSIQVTTINNSIPLLSIYYYTVNVKTKEESCKSARVSEDTLDNNDIRPSHTQQHAFDSQYVIPDAVSCLRQQQQR